MDISCNVGTPLNKSTWQLTSNPDNRGTTEDREFFRANAKLLPNQEELMAMEAAFLKLSNPGTFELNLLNQTTICRLQNSVMFGMGANFHLSGGFRIYLNEKGFNFPNVPGDFERNPIGFKQAANYAGSLTELIRYATGATNFLHFDQRFSRMTSNSILNVLREIGIDTSRDFTVNGTLFTVRDGILDKKSIFDAQDAYYMQIANNRTYEFADEKTKAWTNRLSDHYFRNAPPDVKQSFLDTMRETGINPFVDRYGSTLAQLAVEKDFAIGGNDNIIGNSLASAVSAVEKILERLANPISTVDDKTYMEVRKNEEIFYESFLRKLQGL